MPQIIGKKGLEKRLGEPVSVKSLDISVRKGILSYENSKGFYLKRNGWNICNLKGGEIIRVWVYYDIVNIKRRVPRTYNVSKKINQTLENCA